MVDPIVDEQLALFVVNSHMRSHPDFIPITKSDEDDDEDEDDDDVGKEKDRDGLERDLGEEGIINFCI